MVWLLQRFRLAIGSRGGIVVNEYLQTSKDHIWAVGDAIEVLQPISNQRVLTALAGPANRQGRIAANNIFGRKQKYTGTIATAIVRVFDLTVATTGLNEQQLRAASIPYQSIHLHPTDHAGYYPQATRLDLKVLFHRQSGLLLGAQVAGKNGVDKRIDVLSTAIKSKMTVSDLADLDLAYSPQYGSAKDPVNLAGMIGENILDGLIEPVQWHELPAASAAQHRLLDVRSNQERQTGFIPGSIHIPLPELRQRVTELDKGSPVIVYCQSGQRSYFACRFLLQNGFAVKNLSGGYLTWLSVAAERKAANEPALAGS